MSLPSHTVDSLVKQKIFWSKSLSYIKSQPDKLLITILVGNNLVNVYTAALATQISLWIAVSSQLEPSLAVAIATGLITFLILVFWEIIPKSFAIKNAQKIGLIVAPIYKVLMTIFAPVIWVLEMLIRVFTGKNTHPRVTEEELESFIDLGKDTGTLEKDEHERLKNTLEFWDTLVEEVMIPRVKVDMLSDTTTIGEALSFYLEHTHSRIPVYHTSKDTVIGILTIRDILREKTAGNESKQLKDLHFKNILKAPISQPIDVLLEIFKTSRQHMAIVLDEYGWVAGIITLEDVIEEVFWEIQDETDYETEEIIASGDNTYIADSGVSLQNILDVFEIHFEDFELDEVVFGTETLSYVITHALERFPTKNESVCFHIKTNEVSQAPVQLCFRVMDINDGMIGKVEVMKKVVEHA